MSEREEWRETHGHKSTGSDPSKGSKHKGVFLLAVLVGSKVGG